MSLHYAVHIQKRLIYYSGFALRVKRLREATDTLIFVYGHEILNFIISNLSQMCYHSN
jgi:hypothetical protein